MKISITVNKVELEFDFDDSEVYEYALELASKEYGFNIKKLEDFANELDIYDQLIERFEEEIKEHFEELAWKEYGDWQ